MTIAKISLHGIPNCFCNTKHVCLYQAGNCFLAYSATFVIRNMCDQIKEEAAFLVYSVTFVMRNMCAQNKEGGMLL